MTALRLCLVVALVLCAAVVHAQTPGQTYVVDSSQAATSSGGYVTGWAALAGTWVTDSSGGYGGSYKLVNTFPNGNESSWWRFRAAPGQYAIYATWMDACELAGNSSTGGGVFGPVACTNPPIAHLTLGGRPFQQIGTLTVPQGNDAQISIVTSVLNSITPNADAIAYIRTVEPLDNVADLSAVLNNGEGKVEWSWGWPPASGSPNVLEVQYRRRAFGNPTWGNWANWFYANYPDETRETGLSIGYMYEFRYRSHRVEGGETTGSSEWASLEPMALDPPDPAPPTQLFAIALSKTKIKLEWYDNSSPGSDVEETGFEIWHSGGDGSGEFALLTTVAAGVTTFSHEGLEPGSEHSYKVRAVRTTQLAYSEFAGPVSKSTLASGTFDSGMGSGVKGHVSGRIGVRDRSMHVRRAWMAFADPRQGSEHLPQEYVTLGGGARQTVFSGHRTCGSRVLVFACEFSYPETVDEDHPNGFYMIRWFKITVGRNGKISVESAPDYLPSPYNPEDVQPGPGPGVGGNGLNWDSDFDGYNDNTNPDHPQQPYYGVVFYPAMLKALMDEGTGQWDPDYANSGGWPAEMTDAERAHAEMWKAFAGKVYSSITEGGVNWAAEIPRCPGEDLDGYDTGGTGGGGSGGGFDPGSYSPSNDEAEPSQPDLPSEKERLKFAEVDFESEVSSIYDINGADWWPGWSVGDATWQIDLRNPFGTDSLGQAVDTWRVTFRYCVLALFAVIGLRETVLALQQV